MAGCQLAPYRPGSSSDPVGYREQHIGEGRYWIVYETGRGGTEAQADRLVRRRASELCPGGYGELPPDMQTVEMRSCDSHPWSPCKTSKAQLWVACTNNPAGQPAAVPSGSQPHSSGKDAPAALSPGDAYTRTVVAAIQQSWLPPREMPGAACQVRITQNADGHVQSVEIQECATAVLGESVRQAVLLASPLPRPTDPASFNPLIVAIFIVPDDA